MAAHVHDGAAAGARDVIEPVGVRAGVFFALLDHVELAHRAFLHQLLGAAVLGREAERLRVHQLDLVLLRGLHHRQAGFERVRERLFDHDVFAGLRRRHRHFFVQVVGDAQHDHVHVFAIEELAVVGERVRDVPLAREGLERGFVHVADRHQLRFGNFLKRLRMQIGNKSTADQSHAHLVHGRLLP